MRAADEDERAVELVHLVEEDVEVEGERLGYPVLSVVGGEVVVPLPHVPRERRLGVHLDLLDVERFSEELPGRLDEARVPRGARVDLAPKVQPHGRAHRVAFLLAEVLRPPLGEERGSSARRTSTSAAENRDGRIRKPSFRNRSTSESSSLIAHSPVLGPARPGRTGRRRFAAGLHRVGHSGRRIPAFSEPAPTSWSTTAGHCAGFAAGRTARHLGACRAAHYDAVMRTALTIDDDLAAALVARARTSGRSFESVVNEALRTGLMTGKEPDSDPEPAPFRVASAPRGFLPDIDPLRLNQLLDLLETERYFRVSCGAIRSPEDS